MNMVLIRPDLEENIPPRSAVIQVKEYVLRGGVRNEAVCTSLHLLTLIFSTQIIKLRYFKRAFNTCCDPFYKQTWTHFKFLSFVYDCKALNVATTAVRCALCAVQSGTTLVEW